MDTIYRKMNYKIEILNKPGISSTIVIAVLVTVVAGDGIVFKIKID